MYSRTYISELYKNLCNSCLHQQLCIFYTRVLIKTQQNASNVFHVSKQKITCKNNVTQNYFQNCVSQVLPLHFIPNSQYFPKSTQAKRIIQIYLPKHDSNLWLQP